MIPAAEAERYVIGAILRDVRVLRSVQEECVPSDFADGRLAAIYSGVIGLAVEGSPVDVVAVADRLRAWDVRGIDLAQLAAWADAVPTTRNAGFYGRLVRENAVRRGMDSVASFLRESGDDVGGVLARSIELLTSLRDHGVEAGADPKSLRALLDVPESEDVYDWTVPGLLERGDRLLLTGSEGGGKSHLLRHLAITAAAGMHPFTGARFDPARVLFVDAENSERQWRRAVRPTVETAIRLGSDPRDRVSVMNVARMDLTRAADLGRVHRFVDGVRPDLIVIGPLYRLIPRAVNSDDDAAPLLAALDSVRDRGITMLVEAHPGHTTSATGLRDLRPRGSAALLGWPEFGLGLRRSKEVGATGTTLYDLVKWRGDRDVRQWPKRLTRGVSQTWPWEVALGA